MSKQKPKKGRPANYQGATPEQVARAIKQYREPRREPKQETKSPPPVQP